MWAYCTGPYCQYNPYMYIDILIFYSHFTFYYFLFDMQYAYVLAYLKIDLFF